METTSPLVVLTLDEQRYALPLSAVERVVRTVEVTPLPNAPDIIAGVVNVQGQIIPVADIRKRFRLPAREITLSDQLIIAHTSRRPVTLVVDAVIGVVECAEQDITAAEAIVPGTEYVKGVAKLKDGMILIHDLNSFLSLEEAQSLEDAMENA
jgi:purine-binding chemotaxis protein CheW